MQRATFSLQRLFITISLFLLAINILFQSSGCKKPEVVDNAKLSFSKSIVTFDTVFTTVGSVTERFTVHNPHNFDVKTDLLLAGGSRSYFSINVDGISGTSFSDLIIPAKDSIFIFVKVTINPDDNSTPFIVEDSIVFHTGTTKQQVNLVAFGENAHFIVADQILGGSDLRYKVIAAEHETVTWTNDKPYVIYGWAVVDSLGKLIIEPGTQIYVHSGGGIWVYRYGNIEVNGTMENPVTFQGDRRDPYVTNNGEQWNRIWINESNYDNIINYAVIKDAFIGIQVAALEEYLAGKTTITNTVIKNNGGWGILGRIANMEVINSEISCSWQYGIECAIGNYTFKHVTVANNHRGSGRKTPSLWVSNGYANGYDSYIGRTNFTAQNCIFTGNMTNEIGAKIYDDPSATLTHLFENCLIKSTESKFTNFEQCIFNKSAGFIDFYGEDFRLIETSSAIDAGKNIGINSDLLGNSRDALPDLGAYEYTPGDSKYIKR